MKSKSSHKRLLIFLGLILFAVPLAIFITLISKPLFLWIEITFSIESVGHSGPAPWCYIAIYILLVATIGFILIRIKSRNIQ
jgi:hypothetical protein